MSDFTDEVDKKRRKGIHYKTALEAFKLELKDFEGNKKDKIFELAKFLEELGYDKEKIAEKVGDDLSGYLSKRYVREVLSDEYKQKNKSRDQTQIDTNKESLCGTSSAIDTSKRKLLVTTDGQTTSQEEGIMSPVDPIYGKTKEQMRLEVEAYRQIQEDKEETLENPQNRVPTVFLSDKSPEFREMEARFTEMEQMVAQMAEDRDTEREKARIWSKKFNQLRGGVMEEENKRLKVDNNNLKTMLSDVDRESLAKEGYKEIEVFKMDSGTTRLLNEISNKSQKTFFLLVHPKTMQIKGARTDVQQHQIEAKRAAGVA